MEGVSSRTYTDKQLREIDQPPFEYQGRTYDQYQASQKQREIERSIRKQKRIQKAAEAGNRGSRQGRDSGKDKDLPAEP